jgi:hypothetical protein
MATKPLDTGTLHEVVSSYASKLHAIDGIRDLNHHNQNNFSRRGPGGNNNSPPPNRKGKRFDGGLF